MAIINERNHTQPQGNSLVFIILILDFKTIVKGCSRTFKNYSRFMLGFVLVFLNIPKKIEFYHLTVICIIGYS